MSIVMFDVKYTWSLRPSIHKWLFSAKNYNKRYCCCNSNSNYKWWISLCYNKLTHTQTNTNTQTNRQTNRQTHIHGRPQGRAMGALAPPGRPRPAKNSMFLDFFGKNSIFFVVFKAKSRFLPSPGKKSADAHAHIQTDRQKHKHTYKQTDRQIRTLTDTHTQRHTSFCCFVVVFCRRFSLIFQKARKD